MQLDARMEATQRKLDGAQNFFFPPVPCALEALTVINPFVLIGHSHV